MKKTPQEYGKKGGKIARKNMSAREWSQHCSHAARVRWWIQRGRRGADGKFCPRPLAPFF
jgi:hypothetical protein